MLVTSIKIISKILKSYTYDIKASLHASGRIGNKLFKSSESLKLFSMSVRRGIKTLPHTLSGMILASSFNDETVHTDNSFLSCNFMKKTSLIRITYINSICTYLG